MSTPALLSLILYGIACGSCALAAMLAIWHRRPRHHVICWLSGALLYALQFLSRWSGFEEQLRTALRSSLVASAQYGDRWSMQGPLAAVAIFGIALLLALVWWWRPTGRQRRSEAMVRIGAIGMLGSLGLIGLRILSFHPLDRLLYAGPVRLNWLLDGGLAGIVILAATLYARRVMLAHTANADGLTKGPAPRDRH